MDWTGVLFWAVLLGLVPAVIAKSKGRSFLAWWFYSFMLFIVALPHSIIIKADSKAIEQKQLDDGEMKKCPYCAELVKSEAVVCRYCGHELAVEIPTTKVCAHCSKKNSITAEKCDCGYLFVNQI